MEATRERVIAATGFTPTPGQQVQIDADARRSVEVLFRDLPRPPLAHRNVARKLWAELIDKHRAYPAELRLPVRQVLDMDRTRPDDPWVIGTKFLVIYSGAPQYVHQLDFLDDWERVAGRYVSDPDGTGWHRGHHCDVNVCLGCPGGMSELSVMHYKRGQWLTLHRCCHRCYGWLRYGTCKPNSKRLAKLH